MRHEPRIPGLRRLFRLRAGTSEISRDVDDEIRFHIESRVEALVRSGRHPDDARALAEREFGDIPASRSELARVDRQLRSRERRAVRVLDLSSDLRFALRGIRRSPLFAAVVIATLALGIGANATMFGILDRLLLRAPSGVREPERLSFVAATRDMKSGPPRTQTTFSYASYRDLAAGASPLTSIAAFTRPYPASLDRGVGAQQIQLQLVSGDYFTTLGAVPAVGRFFGPDEDRPPSGSAVVVIGHRFWQRQFGGDRAVLGKSIPIGRDRFTIVGVAKRDFAGLGLIEADAWMPISGAGGLRFSNAPDWHTRYGFQWLRIVVRQAPRTDSAEAVRAVTTLLAPGLRSDGDSLSRFSLLPALRRQSATVSPNVKIAKLLTAVSAFVLLIACANVANLLLARALGRRQEIAIRASLGAGRGRLIRLLLVEAAILAIAGGIAALGVARVGGALVRAQLLSDVTVWSDSVGDARTLLFTAAVTVCAALLTGLIPALRVGRADLGDLLRAGARTSGGRSARVRTSLLLVQGVLSVVLLFGTGLVLRSLINVNAIRLGLDAEQVVISQADLTAGGSSSEEAGALWQQLAERARAIPGVENASLTVALPFASMYGIELSIPGRDSLPKAADGGYPDFNPVDEHYFSVLRMPIVRGRGFTHDEVATVARVALVNESMAKLVWPREEPLGQCMKVGGDTVPCSIVIGVVKDARRLSLFEDAQTLQFYTPLGTEGERQRGNRTLLMRVRDTRAPARESIRRELQQVAANLPYIRVQPMRELLASDYRPWELGATMFSVFGGLALVLAAIGWYASLGYEVEQRVRELGVRLALGASPAALARHIVRRGLAIAMLGLLGGGAMAALLVRALKEFLYEVSPADPVVIALVTMTMLLTALLATLIPGLRAARTDPMAALRSGE